MLVINKDMKTFKQFISEQFVPGPEYFYRYKNKWVIDTFHALERRDKRANYLTDDDLKLFFNRMIDDFLDRGPSYTKRDGKYLYYSKSFDQAILVTYRKDNKSTNGNREFIVISYFRPGSKHARKDTQLITIESNQNSPYISQSCINYLIDICENKMICENIVENMYHNNQSLIVEDSNQGKLNIDFIFDDDGKVWDVDGIEILEID